MSDGTADPSKRDPWRAIGAIAGAVTACALLVTVVGAVTYWLRVRHLGVPADVALTQAHSRTLVSLGLRELVLPAVLAGGVFGAIAWAGDKWNVDLAPIKEDKTNWWLAGGYVALLVLAVVVVRGWGLLALAAGGLCLSWFAGGSVDRYSDDGLLEVLRMALLAAAVVSVWAVASRLDPPADLDLATVTLKAGSAVDGVYLGMGEGVVRVGTGRRIVAVPLADVSRIDVKSAPEVEYWLPTVPERLLGSEKAHPVP